MKQLDPKAVWLFFLSSIPRFIFLGIIFTVYGGASIFFLIFKDLDKSGVGLGGFIISMALVFLIVLSLTFLWAKLSYRFYKYELNDNGFHKESGVIYKRYTTIPYERIQNVDIYRGILARLLGLSDLQIQTAGSSAVVSRFGMAGGGAEGRLQGVSMATAEQLRDELIRRSKLSRSQGL